MKSNHEFPVPYARIQWKGTDVCMDVQCVCGKHFHADGWFAHYVRCPFCQVVLKCNPNIELIIEEEEQSECIVLDGFDPRAGEIES